MSTPPPHRDDTTHLVAQAQSSGIHGVTIRVLDASASPTERDVTNGSIVIGAGLGADIVIDDSSVSRRHLQLSIANDEIEITDLGSRNGTFYQGQRIGRLTLSRQAVIALGRVSLSIVPHLIALKPTAGGYDALLGQSPPMLQLFAKLKNLESTNVPVIIVGETGTGRSSVAHSIHQRSLVATGPFIELWCDVIDRTTFRPDLLGGRQDMTPGTAEDHVGPFESAHGGTLFLNHLDALSLDVQALLLQTLETRQVVRIGESSKRDASFRVIAAASPGFADKVAEGAFRRDLYDQLNALTLCLPPLRERREDIGLLARAFAAENQVVRLPPQVIEHLEQYSWPGNVGELRSIIAGYAAIGEMPQAPIESDERLAELLSRVLDVSRPYQVQKDQIFNLFVDVYLTMLLEYTHGNQSEAARVSGLDRAHLNKMVARLRRESKGFPSAR